VYNKDKLSRATNLCSIFSKEHFEITSQPYPVLQAVTTVDTSSLLTNIKVVLAADLTLPE